MPTPDRRRASSTRQVVYSPARLPILFRGDAVVFGGSLAGIGAALKLAAAGRKVIVVEPRTYLGAELTATGRAWLDDSRVSGAPEPLASFASKAGPLPESVASGETPFTMDALKLHLEDALLAAGVGLLYATLPVSLEADEQGVRGVVIGNKAGRQFIACPVVIDAEPRRRQHPHGGAEEDGDGDLVRVLDFDLVRHELPRRLPVPSRFGLVGDEVIVHRGHRSEKHALVECRFSSAASLADREPPTPAASGWDPAADLTRTASSEMRVRSVAMEVAVHLMNSEPSFAGAYLAGTSLETAGIGGHSPLRGRNGDPQPGVLSAQASWDPYESCLAGNRLGEELVDDWPIAAPAVGAAGRVGSTGDAGSTGARGSGGDPPGRLEIREFAGHGRSGEYELAQVGALALPLLREVDLLVVGGGTSGATAATVAAQEGLETVLVEMNPGLGGTGTYGGVNDYWFGRKVGFAGRLNEAVAEFHRCLRHEVPEGEVPRWNIEAKAHVLSDRALGAGVEILFDAFVIGTIVEAGDDPRSTPAGEPVSGLTRPASQPDGEPAGEPDRLRVRGVVALTRNGPVALLGRTIIDATGDGDVATFAGARHAYGAERGHVTMWYSLAQFALPGHTRNNFTSTVNIGDVEDYTRAILAGRRRRRTEKALHDHGVYLAPRETRHVLGEVVLTLGDQLLQRAWPDVINIAYSNNDVKGHTTSDWVRLGLISPNLEVEIPYRALVPLDVDNVLVVGKAISATHDALPAIRMQADLENLGGVAALAAAQAGRRGTSLRDLDVRELQERLAGEGVLPDDVPTRRLEKWRPSEARLRDLIEELPWREPLHSYAAMGIGEVFRDRIPIVDIACAGPHVVPLLERAHDEAEGGRRLRLAQALAIVGSRAGVGTLVEAIAGHLADGELPPRAKGILHAVAPPDQGAMPEVVYLVHALGMARDPRAMAVWQRIADLLAGVTRDDIRDPKKDVFDYVDSVAVGAERLGDPLALPILAQIHSYEPFRDQVSRELFQADYFDERQAYLELILGRAMARCGGPRGFEILIGYLEDSRAMLAGHAHSELVELSGIDLGWKRERWCDWLADLGGRLPVRPWLGPTDATASWRDDDILISPGR